MAIQVLTDWSPIALVSALAEARQMLIETNCSLQFSDACMNLVNELQTRLVHDSVRIHLAVVDADSCRPLPNGCCCSSELLQVAEHIVAMGHAIRACHVDTIRQMLSMLSIQYGIQLNLGMQELARQTRNEEVALQAQQLLCRTDLLAARLECEQMSESLRSALCQLACDFEQCISAHHKLLAKAAEFRQLCHEAQQCREIQRTIRS